MNNIIKTILMVLASMMVSVTVYAETLKIIIPAGPDGSFNTRFQILKGEIENTWGDDVKIVYGDNCARGTTLVNNEAGPMLTIWDANFNLSDECKFDLTRKNIIAAESNYLRLCAAPGSTITASSLTQPGASYKVGHSTPHSAYQKWFDGYNQANGTELSSVPYGSSGKARRGLLAGDIDLVFISPSNSNKVMKAGGTCFFSTGPDGEARHELPALSSVTSYEMASINQAYFYATKNVGFIKKRKLRKLFNSIADGNSTEFTKFAGTKDIYLVGTTSQMSPKEMVAFIDGSIANWR